MSKSLEQKIIDLESSLGLLQHDYEQQNAVLLENSRSIQQLELSVKRLMDQVAGLQSNMGGDRLLKDEKPPHY